MLKVVSWQQSDQSVQWELSLMFDSDSSTRSVRLIFKPDDIPDILPFVVKLGRNDTPLIPWLSLCDLISDYRDLEEFRFE